MTLREFQQKAKRVVDFARDGLVEDKYIDRLVFLAGSRLSEDPFWGIYLDPCDLERQAAAAVEIRDEHDPEGLVVVGEIWATEEAAAGHPDMYNEVEALYVAALAAQWQCLWVLPFDRVMDGGKVQPGARPEVTREILLLTPTVIEVKEGDVKTFDSVDRYLAPAIPDRRIED